MTISKKKIFFTASIFLVILIGVTFYKVSIHKNIDASAVLGESVSGDIIQSQSAFYDPYNFNQSVAGLSSESKPYQSFVITHHLLASEYIAKMFSAVAQRDINKIIIVGPNHENIGTKSLATTKASWQTAFGNVETSSSLLDNFISSFNTNSDSSIFANEHSVGVIVPYVKYYFPQATILPIAISSYVQPEEILSLSKWLSTNVDNQTLVVFSIDFSHYLNKNQADSNDLYTEQLILNRDIGKIWTLNNDYVDSPGVLATALSLANINNLTTEIVAHGNSTDFLVEKESSTTSYFIIGFSPQIGE